MRLIALALALTWLSVGGLSAQVSVEVLLDQDQFLRDESLPVKVRIANRSGQTLHLGAEEDWLSFTVEHREGKVVTKLAEVPVAGEFSLESAMVATRRVDLMPYFDLSLPGRYLVTATLKVRQWKDEFASRPRMFEIVRGTKLWEQEVGVPTTAGPPEVRKYTLQQAAYLKKLLLYVRLTDDSERRVFRVFPVGPLVSFSRPEAQVDRWSNLHLLFQTGARSFRYLTIDPDGGVTLQQTHEYGQTRPVLRSGEAGQIVVTGGRRRLAPDDVPPPSRPSEAGTNELSSAHP